MTSTDNTARPEKFHGRVSREKAPCEWPGCEELGEFKAPNTLSAEGPNRWYCLGHVREFNEKYDFFKNMSEDEIERFQMDAFSWHRPTWKFGQKHNTHDFDVSDPFDLEAEHGASFVLREKGALNRPLRPKDHAQLATLGLDYKATKAQIKSQYKSLVKKYHPDRNKGSENSANQLREVVEAYNYLKQDFAD